MDTANRDKPGIIDQPSPTASGTGLIGRSAAALRFATSPNMLVLLSTVYALSTLAVAVVYLTSLDGIVDADGKVVTGDFLNFYNGGRMIAGGNGDRLFDLDAQGESQLAITGPGYAKRHWYNYPPTLAIVLSPICVFPYLKAFYLYDALMAAAMLATWWMLRSVLPTLRSHWYVVIVLATCFHPIVRNIIGGQNTVLTLMLISGAYANLRHRRQVIAGLFLGALLFKPHYALMLIALAGMIGAWRTVWSAGAVGALHYLVGAAFCGLDWPAKMLALMSAYRMEEQRLNAATHFSLPAAIGYAAPAAWATLLTAVGVCAVLFLLMRICRRTASTPVGLPLIWAAGVTAMLLVSPHAQYYDAGLLVLPVLLGLEAMLSENRSPSNTWRLFAVVGYLGYTSYDWVHAIGFQPLVFWPIVVFTWLFLAAAWKHGRADAMPGLPFVRWAGS